MIFGSDRKDGVILLFSGKMSHSVHRGINPPLKTPPLLAITPLKYANCPSPLFLSNPPSISVFHELPP